MLDIARAAAQSDPDRNGLFSRRWTGPPPRNRKGPGRDTQAHFGKLNSAPDNTLAELAAQRACRAAVRRAAALERRAEIAGAIGYHEAAGRMAAIAEGIRAVLT